MKRLIAILLSAVCFQFSAFGQVAGGVPVFSGPSGAGSAVITTNEFDASAIVSGTISDDRLPATITSDITGNAATATTATTANNITAGATLNAVNGAAVYSVVPTNFGAFDANNNITVGGSSSWSGSPNNNVVLGGSGGNIFNSIYSLIGVANAGGNTIENCQTCAIITANEATIFNSQHSVIAGGQHVGMGGAGGGIDGHNFIGAGNNVYIGDEFSSDIFYANASLGGEFIYHFDGTSRSGSVGGERLYFYGTTNAFSVGSNNRLSGYGPMAIGSLLTNSQNHEVVLGRYGSEVRIKTNGVTTIKKIQFEGGASSGNITNTAAWQIAVAGSAVSTLYTNGTRRGTLYFTGQSGEFGAMVTCGLVTYEQGGTGTNFWGKTTIYDTGDVPGFISVSGPISPNQVYYIETDTSLTTYKFHLVYE